ncbi:50S ribosomal protein L24-like [Oryza brachyantha]|uniref:50S ribosomal protein L24-like n=1 Tax=Oryza brachyantha TaxID=4533 RepID=UPI001ADB8340|nr:50S ribosomal protein L24-like [Oryza brachyantha]
MGWKATEKLIRHWKILCGDNVNLFPPAFLLVPYMFSQNLQFLSVCFQVMIIRGKDKGKSGLIKRVIRSQNRVIVEGKNLVKKHIKQGEGYTGGIFSIEAPLHVSNVQVLDPGKPGKIGYKYLEDGTKVRFARGMNASGVMIPRPEILKERRKPTPTSPGPKDTPIDLVLEKTYDAKAEIGMPDL